MNVKIRKAILNLIVCYCQIYSKFRADYKYVLVLSHMRSGSTLLVHLLASNKNILCYGESQISYESQRSLTKLIAKNCIYRKKVFPTSIFIGDKILHSRFKLDIFEKFQKDRLKIIYLLREPLGTISSLNNAGSKEACEYYFERMDTLYSIASRFSGRIPSLLLSYDNLIRNTNESLNAIQKYLELKDGFNENYPILPTTGKLGIGDASENIKTGKIVRSSKPIQMGNIPEVTINQLNQCYSLTWDTIKESAITIT